MHLSPSRRHPIIPPWSLNQCGECVSRISCKKHDGADNRIPANSATIGKLEVLQPEHRFSAKRQLKALPFLKFCHYYGLAFWMILAGQSTRNIIETL